MGSGYELTILDVTDPVHPQRKGFAVLPGLVTKIAVDGRFAYVTWVHIDPITSSQTAAGLQIIDVSDPSTPSEVGHFFVGPGFSCCPIDLGVAVNGNYVYMADLQGQLLILDASNPTAPTQVGLYTLPGYAHDIVIQGQYAYVADGEGLRVVDLSNPVAPSETGFYAASGPAINVALAGHRAYLSTEEKGLWIVDVSDPSAPVDVGFYSRPSTFGYVMSAAVAGNYAYVAASGAGLRVVDISNPGLPKETGFYLTPDSAQAAAVGGDFA